eukprot:COSAG05_NODE_24699_length_231_cov_3.818182_1_plen_48_part_10
MQVVMDFYYDKLTLVKCLEIYHTESCCPNLRFGMHASRIHSFLAIHSC